VWLDLRTASTVKKLISKIPQQNKDYLRVRILSAPYSHFHSHALSTNSISCVLGRANHMWSLLDQLSYCQHTCSSSMFIDLIWLAVKTQDCTINSIQFNSMIY
jgi:hypothetical protein